MPGLSHALFSMTETVGGIDEACGVRCSLGMAMCKWHLAGRPARQLRPTSVPPFTSLYLLSSSLISDQHSLIVLLEKTSWTL